MKKMLLAMMLLGATLSAHDGARHHLALTPSVHDYVQLEDASIWAVRPDDQHKVRGWKRGDPVMLTQNLGLLPSYQYLLINEITTHEVEVNMSGRPMDGGTHTYTIDAIDDMDRKVTLSDGSVWDIPRSDVAILEDWDIDQPVVIGVYDSWFSKHSHILIYALNPDSYVRANYLN